MDNYGLLINYLDDKSLSLEVRKFISKINDNKLISIDQKEFITSFGGAYSIYYKHFEEVKMFNEINKALMTKIINELGISIEEPKQLKLNKKI